jgi:ComF family protein
VTDRGAAPRALTQGLLDALALLAQGALDFLHPPACFACGEALRRQPPVLCAPCAREIARPPVRFTVEVTGKDGDHHVLPAFAVGLMGGVLETLVLGLKYRGWTPLAECLGARMARAVARDAADLAADLVVPVPADPLRRRERGFNQAELLAREVARRLGRPLAPGALRKTRAATSQTKLPAARRRENVRDLFQPRQGADLRGRGVLLVDDVATTGATLAEAARALRTARGRVVAVLVAARAP